MPSDDSPHRRPALAVSGPEQAAPVLLSAYHMVKWIGKLEEVEGRRSPLVHTPDGRQPADRTEPGYPENVSRHGPGS